MKIIILFSVLTLLIIRVAINPSLALTGAILLFPLEQLLQSTLSFFLTHNSFMNILIVSSVLLAFMVKIFKSEIKFSNLPPIYYLICSLFLYATVSSLWVRDPTISEAVLIEKLPYIIVFVLLLPLTINSSKELSSTFLFVLLLGALLMVVTLFLVEWDVRRIVLDTGRAVKEIGNPLAISRFAGEISIIALFFGIKQPSLITKIISWVVMVLGILVIIKSGTRGQLIALFIVAVFFSIKLSSVKHTLMIAFVGVVFGFIVMYFLEFYWGEHGRWSSARMEDDISGRFNNIRILIDLWLASPVTMLFGLGNSASYHPSILGLYPHNMTLEILCEEGLIGFSIFVAIVFKTFKAYYSNNSMDNHINKSLFALFIYAFIVSFKQGSMLGNFTFFMYAIVLSRILNENKK